MTRWLAVVLAVILLPGVLFGSTFWLFAGCCALGRVWTFFAVPETKGRSLEQIQLLWEPSTLTAPRRAATPPP